jgi:hypothetical protein
MTRTYARAWLSHLPSWQGTSYPVNRGHEGQAAFVRDLRAIEAKLSTVPGYPGGEVYRVAQTIDANYHLYTHDCESIRRAIVEAIKPTIAEWLAKFVNQETP